MAGKCFECEKEYIDCKCDTIKVWAQMFFNDGSVSEAKRINSAIFDESIDVMRELAIRFLKSVNRDDGFLLVWGAGEMFNGHFYIKNSTSS